MAMKDFFQKEEKADEAQENAFSDEDKAFQAILDLLNMIWGHEYYDLNTNRIMINRILPGVFFKETDPLPQNLCVAGGERPPANGYG